MKVRLIALFVVSRGSGFEGGVKEIRRLDESFTMVLPTKHRTTMVLATSIRAK
jgi:hypothetical protein